MNENEKKRKKIVLLVLNAFSLFQQKREGAKLFGDHSQHGCFDLRYLSKILQNVNLCQYLISFHCHLTV